MTEILEKATLAPLVTRYVVAAPRIARQRKPGQFVLVRVTPKGERIPLTIADADPERGTVTLVVQEVGKTTALMAELAIGSQLSDIAGPLGTPTHIERVGSVVCIGGGIGVVPLHPIAQALKRAGNRVTTILGARTAKLLIMEEEMRRVSDELLICTDDGTRGSRGFVSQTFQELVDRGQPVHQVVAIGPAIMMKAICDATRPRGIRTLVSLNPIMVDGTGMCGGCRVEVDGQAKFACVDGPEFDGHRVNFDLLIKRQAAYRSQERVAYERYRVEHECALERKA